MTSARNRSCCKPAPVSGGGERSQVGSGLRRGRSLVEGSGPRWRGAVSSGGERSQMDGSCLRWRGAPERPQVEQSRVEGSGLRSNGAVSGREDSEERS